MAKPFQLVSAVMIFIASLFIRLGGNLHMFFNTKLGQELKAYIAKQQELIKIKQQLAENQAKQKEQKALMIQKNRDINGTGKLYNIIKGNNNVRK